MSKDYSNAHCAKCKQEVSTDDGFYLTIPPEDHPKYEEIKDKNVRQYGVATPFICYACSK